MHRLNCTFPNVVLCKVVHDAEDHLGSVRLAAEAARKKLGEARLQLRLKRQEFEKGLKLIYIFITIAVYILWCSSQMMRV